MGMPEFLSTASLKSYMDMMGITTLTQQTLLPFSLIISKEIFDKYVRQQKKLLDTVEPRRED
jgi:hypothetical protein